MTNTTCIVRARNRRIEISFRLVAVAYGGPWMNEAERVSELDNHSGLPTLFVRCS